uniref:LPS biosynthesis protein n=1 Tax=Loa loa TaxID=7209 RepID=A0A1I7VCP7_LOALO
MPLILPIKYESDFCVGVQVERSQKYSYRHHLMQILEQSQHLEYRQILPVDLYSSIRWPGLLIFQAAQLFAVTNYEIQNETLVGPANWTTFAWVLQRSRFISCREDFAIPYRKAYPLYFRGKPRIRNEVILTLQRFRNWAIERGMTPILYAGTLLGWYRECGIIPYTHDIDFMFFIEEYYNKFPEDVMNSSFIKLSLRFNRPEDLLEYKVYIEDSIPMDIFFLYHDQNSSWTGGLSFMTMYRQSEYGKRWSEPLHSSKYVWNETPLNTIEVGTISPEQTAESYIQYD